MADETRSLNLYDLAELIADEVGSWAYSAPASELVRGTEIRQTIHRLMPQWILEASGPAEPAPTPTKAKSKKKLRRNP